MQTSEELFESKAVTADETVAELVHELATPLTGVLACLQAVQGATLAESERQELLDAMHDGLQRALGMVSRLSAEGLRGRGSERIDVRELVSRCALLLKPDRSIYDVLVPAATVVWGDRRELSQAVTNVLLNALEASPAGSTITIRAREEDGMTAILVEDRGPGFPDDVRAELTSRAPTFTTKRAGRGLGLSITRRILEAHRGSISFETGREGGGLVSLRLPRSGHP